MPALRHPRRASQSSRVVVVVQSSSPLSMPRFPTSLNTLAPRTAHCRAVAPSRSFLAAVVVERASFTFYIEQDAPWEHTSPVMKRAGSGHTHTHIPCPPRPSYPPSASHLLVSLLACLPPFLLLARAHAALARPHARRRLVPIYYCCFCLPAFAVHSSFSRLGTNPTKLLYTTNY
ncbi:hypothetical protein CALVIDRAFT_83429 [Calocera viscosa TUFC12733]|uniref:Uncharacterized protein n=1 Tax=Calocera viscosa (strain TUFC12733) TaxID=1330018 RepID=A0A167N3V7_CALVF|nr:hypothetical protein CALVIDRAFT_83429 [Calocera viscosa TUFC12733]